MNVNFQVRQDAQLLWPTLRLEEFCGPATGWGLTQSRFGGLQNQFRIAAKGRWKARRNMLHLTETYSFDDGHVDTLNWKIEKLDDGGYRGKESRIPGTAIGEAEGNAVRWQYRRRVPQKSGQDRLLGFDDRFCLQERDVLVSRASVSKFGVEIATISAFFVRGR